MAQFRYSASIIGRSNGRSATAAAAYRAAEVIHDQRTGVTHDYTAKRGVLHSEIMLPDNTPDWMGDRAQLWNAVEAAERRRDSQLAREIILSLPHELTNAQRIELVRGFVQDRFTAQGIIADIAVHAPGKGSDYRNHHAHIMLTMRELTSAGFGKKVRLPLDERKQRFKDDREAWAVHQNRMFERLNMPQRVDHRSYSDQNIDRAPTLHLGPYATELEKRGVPTRLGDANRKITQDNSRIAEAYRLRAEADTIRKVIPFKSPMPRRPITPVYNFRANPDILARQEEAWRQRNHERYLKLDRRELYESIELGRKQEPQKHNLEADLLRRNDRFRKTVTEELRAIERRLQAKGVTKFFRNLTGKTRSDRDAARTHQMTLDAVAAREAEERAALAQRHANEKAQLIDRYRKHRENLEHLIAYEADKRKAYRERAMDDERPKSHERRIQPQPPKPAPTLHPAPPRGAGPARTRGTQAGHDRKVEEWARSEEGKRQLAKDRNPNQGRLDWQRAAAPPPKSEPAPKKEFYSRYPKREQPKPAPENTPKYEPEHSKQRGDFWKAAARPAPEQDRAQEWQRKDGTKLERENKPEPKRDFNRDRERD